MSYFSKALVIGVGVLLPILSSAAVTVRFVARQERKQAILMDDFLSCLSWVWQSWINGSEVDITDQTSVSRDWRRGNPHRWCLQGCHRRALWS